MNLFIAFFTLEILLFRFPFSLEEQGLKAPTCAIDLKCFQIERADLKVNYLCYGVVIRILK
jgi:hypothetical protein